MLGDAAHHPTFDLACRIYCTYARDVWERVIASYGAEGPALRTRLARLDEVIPQMREAGIGDREDAARSVLAWDVGRLVALTRAAYDSGYIDAEEAWQLIERANEQARAHYRSWREWAASYVIGRALWGGDEESLEHFIEVCQRMLEDPSSPYCTTTFG